MRQGRAAAGSLGVGGLVWSLAWAVVPLGPAAQAQEQDDRGDWIVDPDQDDGAQPSLPTVMIADPPAGAVVDGDLQVAVEVTAVAAVEWVEVRVDGQVVAELADEPFELLLATEDLDSGDHELSVSLRDALGLQAEAEPVAFSVDRSARPRASLEEDLTAGVVSVDDYTRYAIYRLFAPDLVPVEYRVGEQPVTEGDALSLELLEALRFVDELQPETLEELEAFLTPQPDEAPAAASQPEFEAGTQSLAGAWQSGLDCASGVLVARLRLSCRYDSEHATIYFNLDEVPGEDRLNPALVPGPDGVPDYVNRVAFALDRAYDTYRAMGYREPSRRVQVVITPISGGFASPLGGVIFLDRSASPVYLPRHELFHQFQYEYVRPSALVAGFAGCGSSPAGWWLEATAEWAAYRAGIADEHTPIGAPALRVGYAARLPDFLGQPQRALATFRSPFPRCSGVVLPGDFPQYGAFVFAEFLAERFGPQVIRDTWEEIERQGGQHTLRSVRDVIALRGGDLPGLMAEFHDRNYRLAYANPDVADWRLALSRFTATAVRAGDAPGLPRPARDVVSLQVGETLRVRRQGLGAGGASYLDVRYPLAAAGRLEVTVAPRRHADGSTGQLRAWLVPFDRHPNRCGVERVDVDLTTGGGSASLTVEDTGRQCTHATLVLSHTDPLGEPSRAVDVTLTYERVEPAALIHDSEPDGWWRLGQSGGTVMWDSSGHGRHGNFSGAVRHRRPGALYTQAANKATGFTTGARATVPAAEAFDGPHASVETWLRTRSGLGQWVFTQGGSAGPLRLRTVGGGLVQATVRVAGSQHTVTGATVVDEGRWHHVALTYDGVTLRLYVDGAQDVALLVGGGLDSRAGLAVAVGHATNASGQEFRGDLDEVAIYRRALSASEIRSRVLNAGRDRWSCEADGSVYAALVCASQPVGYWRLDDRPDGVQLMAADRTVPANDGVYHSGVRAAQRPAVASEPAAAVTGNGLRTLTVPYDDYGRFALTEGSVEVWLRTRHLNAQQVFTYGGSAGAVTLYTTGGGLVQATVRTTEGTFAVTGSTVVNEGRWHHVALVYDRATLRLYVDGEQDAATPATGDLRLERNAALALGHATNTGGWEFRGDLDELAVYDHPLPGHAISRRVEVAGSHTWSCEADGSAYAALVCASQPVGYWRLGDEPDGEQLAATDQTLPANDGLYHSGVRAAQRPAVASEPTAAVTGDGLRTLTVPYDDYGRFALTEGSVEVWLRTRHTSAQQVFAYGGYHGAVTLSVAGGGLVQATVRTVDGAFTVTGSTLVNEGRWHHVALVYDRATLRLYVDGEQDAATPATGDLRLERNAALALGHATTASGVEFRGDLDEFAVYDHPLPAHAISRRVEIAGAHRVDCQAGGYGATVCADAPVGYWPLDGTGPTITDVTSNANHGTHGLAATPGVPGRYGDAVRFDPNGSHSEIPDEPYGHYANDQLSVEVWFRTEQPGLRYLVSRGGTSGQFTLALSQDGGVHARLSINGAIRTLQSSPNLGVDDGAWHHLALTYDGWTMRLYLDGTQVATQMSPGRVDWFSRTPIALGRATNTTAGRFQGDLDELALYAHALPAPRVAARGDSQ